MRDCQFSRGLRTISTVVLSFFIWTFGGVFDIAYAIKSDQQSAPGGRRTKGSDQHPKPGTQTPGEKRHEEKFSKDMDDLEGILKDNKPDHETKKQKIKGKKAEIDADDVEIKKQFKETEEKIKDLPKEIQQRHKDFVKLYDKNMNELKANLDAIEKAKTKKETDAAIEKTNAHLEKTKPPKKHQKLDPNKLPHRTEVPVFKEPRTKPEEFLNDSQKSVVKSQKVKPILLAMNGDATGLLSSPIPDTQNPESVLLAAAESFPAGSYQVALANPPTDADLAETIEVQFTPEIRAKAAELGNSPTKIYNWVRNNIEYVPTYGSIQGATMCLQTKQCNDFDTASLLIALLRVSGIHAKYVYGTIELPIEKVKNWVGGFTDSMAALNLMASGGIPVGGITEGGKIVTVRKEHVWVEAWVDMIPSQGAAHKKGDTWVSLDASFKQYNYVQGIDIKTAVPFDAQTFVNKIQSTATINEQAGCVTGVNSSLIQQTMQDYQAQVQNYISQHYPNATVGDVLGKKDIIEQEFRVILGTLPYKSIAVGTKYSSLPDSLRHKVTFGLTSDNIYYDPQPLSITKSLPEIAGKKITLSYAPATQADENVINSYLPKPHADGTPIQPSELPSSLPAYLINLKPELRINGILVATGGAIGMGQEESLNIDIAAPTTAKHSVSNRVIAGEFNAIALDIARISPEQMTALKTKLETTKAKLEAQDFEGLTKDDILGDILYTTVLSYFAELNITDYVTARTMNVTSIRLPSAGRFFNALLVDYVFGMPVKASSGGLSMDIGLIRKLVKSPDGIKDKQIQFMINSGASSSSLEHAVPEQLFSTPETPTQGISAIKALQLANDQGIPIYKINQTNINSILPQLQVDSDVKEDIQNAVNAGKIVSVSKTNINFNGWTGCGYIVIDPDTGAGAYMISGGINGAWYNSKWIDVAWTIGYYELYWLSLLGKAALAALAAIVLVPVLGAIISALGSLVLWLAAGAAVLYFYLSEYAVGAFVIFITGLVAACVEADPDPNPIPSEEDAVCAFLLVSLILMAKSLGGNP